MPLARARSVATVAAGVAALSIAVRVRPFRTDLVALRALLLWLGLLAVPMIVLGLAGILYFHAVVLWHLAVLVGVLLAVRRHRPADWRAALRQGLNALVKPLPLLLGTLLLYQYLAIALPVIAGNSWPGTDALAYHLPIAARAIQTHSLSIHQFDGQGYDVTGYYPATGGLLWAWSLWAVPNGAAAPLVNCVWLGILLCACCASAKLLGIRQGHAVWPVVLVLGTDNVQKYTGMPFTDMAAAACFVACLVLGVWTIRTPTRCSVFFFGLASGLGIGVKPDGVVLVAGLWGLTAVSAILARRAPRILRLSPWALVPTTVLGVIWFLRNWGLTGHPLFPFGAAHSVVGLSLASQWHERFGEVDSLRGYVSSLAAKTSTAGMLALLSSLPLAGWLLSRSLGRAATRFGTTAAGRVLLSGAVIGAVVWWFLHPTVGGRPGAGDTRYMMGLVALSIVLLVSFLLRKSGQLGLLLVPALLLLSDVPTGAWAMRIAFFALCAGLAVASDQKRYLSVMSSPTVARTAAAVAIATTIAFSSFVCTRLDRLGLEWMTLSGEYPQDELRLACYVPDGATVLVVGTHQVFPFLGPRLQNRLASVAPAPLVPDTPYHLQSPAQRADQPPPETYAPQRLRGAGITHVVADVATAAGRTAAEVVTADGRVREIARGHRIVIYAL